MSFWKNLRNVKKKECGSAPKAKDELLAFIEDEAEKTREHLDNLPDSCVPVWYRRNRKPPKERWAYVGRAGIKGFDPEWWVYLHPTKDEWYFLDRKDGQASRMGSYRQWTRKFYFEGLTKPYGDRVKVFIDTDGNIHY